MSETIIQLKKFGQMTKVIIGGKDAYFTAIGPKYEKDHIETLLQRLGIENIRVDILDK